MKHVSVNLISPLPPPTWLWWLVGIALAISLVSLAYTSYQFIMAQNARMNTTELASPVPSSELLNVKGDMSRSTYTDDELLFLAEKTSPWPAYLTQFENAEVPGASPKSIEILVAAKTVRVEVEVDSFKTLTDYVNALNAGETTRPWRLLSADIPIDEGSSTSPRKSGSASIVAHWK